MLRTLLIGILTSFLTIIPSTGGLYATGISVPSKAVIEKDLTGRKLSEGTDNGYFKSDWMWIVQEGEISNLKIQSQKVSDDYCTFVVTMILRALDCPTRYRATVQVDYSLNKSKWRLALVRSKGIKVIKTERYFDCISTKIDDDGWGGVNCLKIKNNIDTPLLVGGIYRARNYVENETPEWHKFSVVVDGLKTVGIGGTFGIGDVADYRIHFVELY